MVMTTRPTITEILVAVEKKKKSSFHERRVRIRNWALGIALVAPAVIFFASFIASISGLVHTDSINWYRNIHSEIIYYYATDSYPYLVSQDSGAQMVQSYAQDYSANIFLDPLKTDVDNRQNPQNAIATYRVYIDLGNASMESHTLIANMSIMSDGRHWQINTIKKAF